VVGTRVVPVRGGIVSHFRRVSILARGDDAEPLRARLLALVPAGIEERETDDAVELAAYVPLDGLDALLAELPDAVVAPVAEGWEEAWRSFHNPATAGGLWLGPPWVPPPDPARAVVIDPGRAFGTGAHATTRLCVELLATTRRRGALLDVGCGSGVLAIAAARLGFDPVVAVDHDPVAIETTRANADANGVSVEARTLDAETQQLPGAEVVVANVLLRPVEAILSRIDADEAITSGYLVGERPTHEGWSHRETAALEGWAADRFERV
jgi:ribosomal protein L11 methyltransferase